jgi:glycosyltransferase involved in cell wall biosynthesis
MYVDFLLRTLILFSHEIITVSGKDYCETINLFGGKKKTHLIHHGTKEPIFFEKSIARKVLHQKETGKALWIGAVGELQKDEGYAYAIEAFSATQKNNDVLFFIIGEGADRTNLQKKIEELELSSKVFLLGQIKNAGTLLPAFDIFLSPSTEEGLPFSVLEAGYAKLPVIVTGVGGTPEIVTDMKSGILIRPKDSNEIKKAFEYLFSHKKEAVVFGKNLRLDVKKNFPFKKMLRETMTVYEKLLDTTEKK